MPGKIIFGLALFLIAFEAILILIRSLIYLIRKYGIDERISFFFTYELTPFRYKRTFSRALKQLLPIIRRGKFKQLLIGKDSKIAIGLDNGCKFYWEPGSLRSLLGKPLRGEFEEQETKTITDIIVNGNSKVIFDIGANFGWFAVQMASNSADEVVIHSFEPVPAAAKELADNIELNNLRKKIIVNHTCLGESIGEAEFFIPKHLGSAFASLKPHKRHEDCSVIRVPIDTIDAYCSRQNIKEIDLIKIDVEGAELLVFKGAKNILAAENKPIILMETAKSLTRAFGYEPSEVFAYLAEYGYVFYEFSQNKLTPLKDPKFLSGYNFLCLVPNLHDRKGKIVSQL